jgi:group II intron reverse transcriptase/maturase
MLPDTVIRRLEALGEITTQGKRLNGLFRLMEQPLLWHEAYANIYANHGALTPGVDGTTLDGFSQERVTSIIERLKEGRYRFQPVRRVYVPKRNGKKRPLGISTGDDKLVQEVVRMILERVYEPIFESSSHGFRPRHSPHTALQQIEHEWTAVKWMIDMDLRDYFTTIPHDLLMGLLGKKIEDKRFLRLIQAMLDAGYLEDWTYHATYSGVPQGSIVSPVLANLFLHELDCFMNTLKEQFEQGKKRRDNPIYRRYSYQISLLRKKWDTLKGKEEHKQELREVQQAIKQLQQQRRAYPSGDPFDTTYKRLYYCRYADDFCIGIIGSKADAQWVSQEVKRYIQETLKLTIAEEKSHIRHGKEGVIFLGYWVGTYTGEKIVKTKRGSRHTTFKAISERLQLRIPPRRLHQFCTTKRYGHYQTGDARHRKELTRNSDTEIILAYNAELRGLANYYTLALGVRRQMNKLAYLWQTSLFKTLAHKHKTSVTKTANRLKTDDGYALIVREEHKTRTTRLFRLKDLSPPHPGNPSLDRFPNVLVLTLCHSELIRRLNASQCEYCESRQGPFEVHHIRRMKDVAHKKELWQKMMAARVRKTLVLCRRCHHLLHEGILPDKAFLQAQVKREPCTVKAVSTVRREGDG